MSESDPAFSPTNRSWKACGQKGSVVERLEPNTTHRYPALDSLRGIAAVSVVIYHIINNMPNLPWHLVFRTPLAVFLMGPEAVLLFFVLSGFVLNFQLAKNNNYVKYVAQRVCRIYLPYIAATALAALCVILIPHVAITWPPTLATRKLWSEPLSLPVFAAAALFIFPSTHISKLDPVVWSLVYEMRISLIFPLVLLTLRRFGAPLMLAISAVVSAIVCYKVMPQETDFFRVVIANASWLPTLHYLFLFYCGAAIAMYRESIVALLTATRVRMSVLVISLGLYFAPETIIHRVFHLPINMFTHDWFVTLGVCGIIACSLGRFEVAKFLEMPVLRYLGKISYSLYLTHLIIFLAAMHLLGGHSTYPITAALTALLCIPVAHLSYYYVELPSIRLGRFLGSRVENTGRHALTKFTA